MMRSLSGFRDHFRWSRPTARRVLLYAAIGPLGTLALGALSRPVDAGDLMWSTGIRVIFGLVLVAILRPNSYDRSMWRAVGGVLWLFLPFALSVVSVLPAESVLLGDVPLKEVWNPAPDSLWDTIWFAVGFFGCAIAAVMSARPSLHPRASWAPGSAGEPAAPVLARQVPWPYLRFGMVVGTVGLFGLFAATFWILVSLLSAIPRSHVRANVPAASQFDTFMQRDLTAYFSARDSMKVAVRYQLLRRAPTQTGIAYPKYYAWVRVSGPRGESASGAVRVAAIDRTRFEVYDFMPAVEILGDQSRLEKTFPFALKEDLIRRAHSSAR